MITVLQGDCSEVLPTISKVDCIVTSPPYNLGIKYDGYVDNRPDYLLFMNKVFGMLFNRLNDDGHFFLQVGSSVADPLLYHNLLTQAIGKGFKLQNTIIWVKSITIDGNTKGHFSPLNSKRSLNNTMEHIFHLTKDGNRDIDRLAIGVPFQDKSNIKRFNHGRDVRCGGNVWFIPYDTVKIKREHPAVFPLELPTKCIKLAGLKPGSIVLDPFAGSGTTLTAAKELGFDSIGIEYSQTYVDLINRRYNGDQV